MRHFAILPNYTYEGRFGTPEGIQGVNWIEVFIAPDDPFNGPKWNPDLNIWEEQSLYASETILRSPNGNLFKITVSDEGKIESEPLS